MKRVPLVLACCAALAVAAALRAVPAHAAAAAAAAAAPPAATPPVASPPYAVVEERLEHERFGEVSVLRPAGPTAPRGAVVFLSGEAGWQGSVVEMAHMLVARGTLVVGVDTPRYLTALRAAKDCNYLTADVEELAHHVEKQVGLQQYLVPVVAGYSSGATLAYAALVQSPAGSFAGGIGLAFCPEAMFGKAPLCDGGGDDPTMGLRYSTTKRGTYVLEPQPALKEGWIILQGDKDARCTAPTMEDFARRVGHGDIVKLPGATHAFGAERGADLLAAYDRLQRERRVDAPAARASAALAVRAANVAAAIDVSDLPLVEVPTLVASRRIALMITGDGGWANLDKGVAAALAARGIPLVGFSALKYFWGERTPEETTADLARVLRHYLAAWHASEIMLVGYSFGADVLPFVINRLPKDLRARVVSVTLLGLSHNAEFEVRVAGWMGKSSTDGLPILPELARIRDLPMLCVYGEGDDDTSCDELGATPGGLRITSVKIGDGHHFGWRFADIADRMLAFAAK